MKSGISSTSVGIRQVFVLEVVLNVTKLWELIFANYSEQPIIGKLIAI